MEWLKLITIILIVLIVILITITVILTQTYSNNKGSIEGTGFVIQELDGAGGINFDVDDDENIYFAVDISKGRGVTIYNSKGDYMYTLPITASGGIRIKIDNKNNILVYDMRENLVIKYNNMGIEMDKRYDQDYSLRASFALTNNQNVRERNGVRYININGTIIKEENGIETVVFKIPTWQKWYRAFKLVLILSIVALFLRIAVPLWVRAFKAR